jgi:hypothetical protein
MDSTITITAPRMISFMKVKVQLISEVQARGII